MGIIKRNKIYYVRKMVNGEIIQFSLNTTNARLAGELYEIWLKEKFLKLREMKDRKDVNNPKKIGVQNNDLNQIWEQYFSFKKSENLSKSQMNIKTKVFNDLKAIGLTRIKNMNQDWINKILAEYRQKYQSDSIKKYISEIKCFLNYCIKKGYYDRLEYDRLSWPKLTTKIKTTVITDNDLDNIFNTALKTDLNSYVFLTSMYYLSCRPGEVAGIRKENFDFDSRTCRIWMNKTKKYKVVVITNDQYLEFIKNYLKPLSGASFICNTPKSGEYYSKKFKHIKAKLNLNREYTLYTFRHTAGTNIYKNTKDIKFTANQLGDSEELAMKHYVNTTLLNYQQYSNSL